MTAKKLTDAQRETMGRIEPVPRIDTMVMVLTDVCRRYGKDTQFAPVWAEKLRFSYTKVFETKYPEYAAANGDVLPIDTSVPPGANEWEYFLVDQAGFADWIDDDGTIMPSGSLQARRFTGQMAEMGHKYDVTVFELERATFAGIQISTMKQSNARKVHEAKTNWTWLFGDVPKALPGLVNHPNITVTLAPTAAAAPFGDNRDRLIENKTNDEVLADIETLVETIPRQTIRAHFAARVYMPYADISHLKRRRLGAGDGNLSLWDFIRSNYSADGEDTPAIEFQTLNECDGTFRREPVSEADQSGIAGRFWLAIPSPNKDELAFIRARPYTQRPPQERDLKMVHITHSKVGGCKNQIPLAVHRLDFIANENATASP